MVAGGLAERAAAGLTLEPDDWETPFRQRYETEMIEKNDTHFYVGTIHQHPRTWIIVGLFYPPKTSGDGG